MKQRPDYKTIALVICFFIIIALTGALTYTLFIANTKSDVDFGVIGTMAETIKQQYYFYEDKELSDTALTNAALRGMITELDDPYAQYFTEDEYADLLSSNSGDYVGLGLSVQLPDETGSVIIAVYSGSPAEEGGLRAGDIIVEINGTRTANLSMDDYIACYSDEDGVPDVITYLRDGVETTVTLTRAEIHINRVTSTVYDGDIGYIYISEFNGSVAEDFIAAATALQEQGITKLIIDLRNNPGGGLYEVLNTAYSLIPKGETIVTIKSKSGSEAVYASQGDEQIEMEMAVIVNGNSASASELLTGALQDYGLATVVGTQTYGKGIVQSFFHLGEGEGWAKFTTDAYFTPNDVCIQGIGITPDIVVDLPEELQTISIELLDPAEDTQLQAAINALRAADVTQTLSANP